MPEQVKVGTAQVEAAKKWALIKFREMLRGSRVTDQIQRWLSGELGEQYRFSLEIALDEKALEFIRNPANAEKLKKETLV